MAGYTFNIGINYCDPDDPTDCELDGAIGDAIALRDLAVSLGFKPFGPDDGLLLESKATRAAILSTIDSMAGAVTKDDFVVITYSGFGREIDGLARNRPDMRAWVDVEGDSLLLSEVREHVATLPPGCRVLIVSVACFSGPSAVANARRLRVMSERFLARVGEPLLDADLDSIEPASATQPSRTERDAAAEGPVVVHLAACGLDDRIDDGSFRERSPFVRALHRVRTDGVERTFDEFMTALIKELAEPVPRVEPDPVPDQLLRQLGPFRLPP